MKGNTFCREDTYFHSHMHCVCRAAHTHEIAWHTQTQRSCMFHFLHEEILSFHLCVCVCVLHSLHIECLSCFCLFAAGMHIWMSLTWYAGLVWEASDVLQGCLLVDNCLINRRDSIHFHQHNASLVSAGRGIIRRLTVFNILSQYWRKWRQENANRSAEVQRLNSILNIWH